MKVNSKKFQIGVIGSAGSDDYLGSTGATKQMLKQAELVGSFLAKNGAAVVTGGKSGVMESAAKGAKKYKGTTIGVIKGKKRFTSNQFTDIEVISGMEADGFDEFLLVTMCDALIVIGGGAGTLEEITIAYRNSKPIIVLDGNGGWGEKLKDSYLDERNRIKIETVLTPEKAVKEAFKLARAYAK